LIVNDIGLRQSPHRGDSAGAPMVNVPFALEENPTVIQPRQHHGHVDDLATVIHIGGIEQRFDIVGVQPDASVGSVAVDAYRMIGAMNTDHRKT
jgi:hypothetical protein